MKSKSVMKIEFKADRKTPNSTNSTTEGVKVVGPQMSTQSNSSSVSYHVASVIPTTTSKTAYKPLTGPKGPSIYSHYSINNEKIEYNSQEYNDFLYYSPTPTVVNKYDEHSNPKNVEKYSYFGQNLGKISTSTPYGKL